MPRHVCQVGKRIATRDDIGYPRDRAQKLLKTLREHPRAITDSPLLLSEVTKKPEYTAYSVSNPQRSIVLLLFYGMRWRGESPTLTTVCVFVCMFSSHSFWISSSLDVPAGVTQEEGHTGYLIHLLSAVRALIFLARRIRPFLSLVDREVEFCVLTIQSFSTRWAFLFFIFWICLVRKMPFAGIELTSQRVRRLHGYL